MSFFPTGILYHNSVKNKIGAAKFPIKNFRQKRAAAGMNNYTFPGAADIFSIFM